MQLLAGRKDNNTDFHSHTAQILGISREDSKTVNYARLYGSGVPATSQSLRTFNKRLSQKDAESIAKKMYAQTKGVKQRDAMTGNKVWSGGTESYTFNALEQTAHSDDPRTFALGCAISEALHPRNTGTQYATSKVNWCVQSSGVDFLHCLMVQTEWLFKKYGVDGRLIISVHDEIAYMVKEEHAYAAAYLYQIAHLWTRAFFSYQAGLLDLPESVCWFESVAVDTVLRKSALMDCVTPSQPIPIPPGQELSMAKLLPKVHKELLERITAENKAHSLATV